MSKLLGPRIPLWELRLHVLRYCLPTVMFVGAVLCLSISAFFPWAHQSADLLWIDHGGPAFASAPRVPHLAVFVMGVMLLAAAEVHNRLVALLAAPTVLLPWLFVPAVLRAWPEIGFVLSLVASCIALLGLYLHRHVYKPLCDAAQADT